MLILGHLVRLHKLEIQSRELKVRLLKVSLTGESSGGRQLWCFDQMHKQHDESGHWSISFSTVKMLLTYFKCTLKQQLWGKNRSMEAVEYVQ